MGSLDPSKLKADMAQQITTQPHPQGLLEKIDSKGLKVTRQRRLIVEKLSSFQIPFSAEDLYLKGLKKAGIDIATIYRTLKMMVENNWISQVDVSDGHVRYTVKPASVHLHTLLCKECHKIEHLSGCFVEKQQEELLKKGFTRLSHKVEFMGLCPDCTSNAGATL